MTETTKIDGVAHTRAMHSAEYLAKLASTPGVTASEQFANELLDDVKHGLGTGEYYRLLYRARFEELQKAKTTLIRLRQFISQASLDGYRTVPIHRLIDILDQANA